MKCLTCGKQTKGIDHNKRGLRCEFCWARLPDEPPELKSYSKRKIAELQDELERRGLPAEGNKRELVARLKEDDG